MSPRTCSCQTSQREVWSVDGVCLCSSSSAGEQEHHAQKKNLKMETWGEGIKILHFYWTLTLGVTVVTSCLYGYYLHTDLQSAFISAPTGCLSNIAQQKKVGRLLLSHSIPMARWKTGSCSSEKKIRRYLEVKLCGVIQ